MLDHDTVRYQPLVPTPRHHQIRRTTRPMNDTTIAPDSRPIEPNPDERPTPWVLRRAPEPSNKITVAWSNTPTAIAGVVSGDEAECRTQRAER